MSEHEAQSTPNRPRPSPLAKQTASPPVKYIVLCGTLPPAHGVELFSHRPRSGYGDGYKAEEVLRSLG